MPPRGRGPRGPRGARGGLMGGMPVSRSGKIMVNGHIVNPFPNPAGGYVHSPINGPVDAYATYTENIKRTMRFAIKRNGILKGSLIGIRHMLTNGLHYSAFSRKLAVAEEELKEEKISKEQCDLRKMQAAADYYGYLQKIGYYDESLVSGEMHIFAEKIGVEYDDSEPTDEHTEGRSL